MEFDDRFQVYPMKKGGISLLIGAVMLILLALVVQAEDQKIRGVFGLYVENDVFSASDGGYTNGVKFVWVSPAIGSGPGKGRLPGWLDFLSRNLAFNRSPGSRRFVSASFGHSIYTPENIKRSGLIRDDRPYAGYVSANLGFHSRGRSSVNTLEFEIGLVGPHSFAGDVQKFLHRLFGWTDPRGWANQLRDEPVLGAYYGHKQRILESGKAGRRKGELIVHVDAGLSNLFIGAGAGIEMRAGWNLPDNFGVSLIRPGSDAAALYEDGQSGFSGLEHFGFYVFTIIEGRAVARDLFLDGNSFRRSHRVDKIPLCAEIAGGLAVRYKRFKSSFCYVYQTRTFRTQKVDQLFGSLNLSLIF